MIVLNTPPARLCSSCKASLATKSAPPAIVLNSTSVQSVVSRGTARVLTCQLRIRPGQLQETQMPNTSHPA